MKPPVTIKGGALTVAVPVAVTVSKLSDVDYASAVTQLSTQELALQAAQIAAFIRYVQKFFELTPPTLPTSYSAPPPGSPPTAMRSRFGGSPKI